MSAEELEGIDCGLEHSVFVSCYIEGNHVGEEPPEENNHKDQNSQPQPELVDSLGAVSLLVFTICLEAVGDYIRVDIVVMMALVFFYMSLSRIHNP